MRYERGNTLRHAIAAFLTFFALPALAVDAALIEAARKEGRVVWYTTQIIDQFARPAAQAFEKKYGVKVDYVRADSSEVALRISNEGKAGKMQADFFDGSSAVPALKKQNLVLQATHDSAARLPERYRDKEQFWTAHNEFIFTPAYKSDLVKQDDAPKNFDDLLHPSWKGKMVWSSQPIASGAPGFIGLMLAVRGEEKGMAYLRKLSTQSIAGPKVSARQILDQVIAGEFVLSPHTFNHQSVISRAKGAPSVWIPMNPALGVISVGAITKGGPNPNAAKLFADFLFSDEGQKLFRDSDYIPVDPAVPPRDPTLRPDGERFKAIYMTPEEVEDGMPKWTKIYAELFR